VLVSQPHRQNIAHVVQIFIQRGFNCFTQISLRYPARQRIDRHDPADAQALPVGLILNDLIFRRDHLQTVPVNFHFTVNNYMRAGIKIPLQIRLIEPDAKNPARPVVNRDFRPVFFGIPGPPGLAGHHPAVYGLIFAHFDFGQRGHFGAVFITAGKQIKQVLDALDTQVFKNLLAGRTNALEILDGNILQ